MDKIYNRVILIGNGFDKALGLKSSYADFILNYIQEVAINAFRNKSHETELMSINLRDFKFSKEIHEYVDEIKKRKTTKELLDYIKGIVVISYKYKFFEDIINQNAEARWVDIEQYYYESLKFEFKKSKDKKGINKNFNSITAINNCMDLLSIELTKYIIDQQNLFSQIDIRSPFLSFIDTFIEPLRQERSQLIKRHSRTNSPSTILFLNFNYTNTVQQFLTYSTSRDKKKHLFIHGTVNDESNPIIFGYGDDNSDEYKQLEREGINELLKKIKSFQYPRTFNYHKLLNYLEEREFDVFVVGHSCGLSDGTLLKTIFEHKNCLAIQNFHFKGEPEDFDKRMEISRHFNDKIIMRERVLPFDEFALIPQSTLK